MLLVWMTGSSFSTCCHSKLFLLPVGVEAFPILPGDVEQAAGHLGGDVGILDRERGRLDGKRAAVTADQLLADPARAVADDVLGVLAQDRQAWADAVRGVPHRRQARPVVGPAVHVLLVAPPQELKPAQLAFVVQFLDEQVFAAVNDGLHHHVDFAALALGLDDLAAFVDRCAHRDGASDVLAGLQGLDRHPGVVGDRRVDMDRIDVGVFQELAIVGIAGLDPVPIAAFVETLSGRGGRSRG